MKNSEDERPAFGEGVARRNQGRAARSSRARPLGRDAPIQDVAPRPEFAPDHAARRTEETQGRRGVPEEVIEQDAQSARALQDELLTSRTLRHDADCMIHDGEPVLLQMRENRKQLAWDLEKLKARGARKDAASQAYKVAYFDCMIEVLEEMLQVNGRLIATAEAFEAQVGRMPESVKLIARIRDGTAAPARAGRRRKKTSGLERAHRSREAISVFERAYAETGNPLYVWHALSMLCVHSIPGGNTDDSLLPGWCVDYLSHTAEALLELPPLGGQSEGGIAEQAPAVSKALGLTRQGWNAYAEWQKDRDSVLDADLYARVKALGIPDKDAMEATVEELGLEADRSVRRRLHRARRAKPGPTKPAR